MLSTLPRIIVLLSLSFFIRLHSSYALQVDSRSRKSKMTSSLSSTARRSIGKLKPENTVFLLCDIQERFRSITWRGETIVRTANYMTSVAKALDIPVVVTQQYTKVFGPTVEDVFADQEHFKSCKTFEKKNFSMCTDEVKSHLSALNKKSVVLWYRSTRVCSTNLLGFVGRRSRCASHCGWYQLATTLRSRDRTPENVAGRCFSDDRSIDCIYVDAIRRAR